jgi:hypothetical protein
VKVAEFVRVGDDDVEDGSITFSDADDFDGAVDELKAVVGADSTGTAVAFAVDETLEKLKREYRRKNGRQYSDDDSVDRTSRGKYDLSDKR